MKIPSQKDLIDIIKSIEKANKENAVTYRNIVDTVRMVTSVVAYITEFKKSDLDDAVEKMTVLNRNASLLVNLAERINGISFSGPLLTMKMIMLRNVFEAMESMITSLTLSKKLSIGNLLIARIKIRLIKKAINKFAEILTDDNAFNQFGLKDSVIAHYKADQLAILAILLGRTIRVIDALKFKTLFASKRKAKMMKNSVIEFMELMKILSEFEFDRIGLVINSYVLSKRMDSIIEILGAIMTLGTFGVKQMLMFKPKHMAKLKEALALTLDMCGIIGDASIPESKKMKATQSYAKRLAKIAKYLKKASRRAKGIKIDGMENLAAVMGPLQMVFSGIMALKVPKDLVVKFNKLEIAIIELSKTIAKIGPHSKSLSKNIGLTLNVVKSIRDAYNKLVEDILGESNVHDDRLINAALTCLDDQIKFMINLGNEINKFSLVSILAAIPLIFATIIYVPLLTAITIEIIKCGNFILKVSEKSNWNPDAAKKILNDLIDIVKILSGIAAGALAATLVGSGFDKKIIDFGKFVVETTAVAILILNAGKLILWTKDKLNIDANQVEPLIKTVVAIIAALGAVITAIVAADALIPKDIIDKVINFSKLTAIATAASLVILVAGKTIIWTNDKLGIDQTKVEPLIKTVVAVIAALGLVVGAIMAADALVPADIVDKIINFALMTATATVATTIVLLSGKALLLLHDKIKIEMSTAKTLLESIGAIMTVLVGIVTAVMALEAIAPNDLLNKLIEFSVQTGAATLVAGSLILFIGAVSKGVDKLGITPEKCLAIGKALTSVVALVSTIAATSAGSATLISAVGGVVNIVIFLIMTELIKMLVGRLLKIVELADKLPDKKEIQKRSGKMLQLVLLIGAIAIVAAATTIAGALAAPAVILAPFVMAFLGILPTFTKLLLWSTESLIKKPIDVKSRLEIIKIATIIGSLSAIEAAVLAIAILALPTLICMPVVILMMAMFIPLFWIMRGMIRIIDKMVGFQIAKGLTNVAGVLLGVIGLEILILLIAIAAPAVIKSFLSVLAVFGIIILVLAAAALLGFAVSMAAPVLVIAAYAIVGVALTMLVIVTSIFLIALMLEKLQDLEIDVDAVKARVKLVIECVWDIVSMVFDNDAVNPKTNDFWNSLLGMTGMVLSALAACTILVMTTVSVFCILLIAGLLRVIQMLNLDTVAIAKVVDLVLSTARSIIDRIFEDPGIEAKEDKNSDHTSAIIKNAGVSILVNIVKAICAVAFLALTVFSVLAIMLIAVMLRGIQELNLNPEKIQNNIDLVLGTARSIIDKLFNTEVNKEEQQSPGFWEVLLRKFASPIVDVIQAIMSVAYLAMIMVSIFMIMGIAGQLKLIEKIELNPQTITEKVNAIMSAANECIAAVNKDDDTKTQSGGGWLMKLLDLIGLAKFAQAIVNMGYIAMVFASLGLIGKIANKLEEFEAFKVNPADVSKKVTSIISTANNIMIQLKATKDGDAEDASKSIVKYAQKVTDSLEAVSSMIKALQKVGSFDTQKVAAAKTNVISACGTLDYLIAYAGKIEKVSDKSFKTLISTAELSARYMEQLNKTIESTKYNEAQIEETRNRVKVGIEAISEIISMVDDIKPTEHGNNVTRNCDLIDRISSTIGSFVQVTPEDVKNSKDITENYIKFFKQVDSMDIKKLRHTDWLMRSWASISKDLKGDFEGLAKTINQHIMPMLEKVNETLEKTTKAQQDIIDIMSQPVDINNGGNDTEITIPPSDDTNTTQTGGGGYTPSGGSGIGGAGTSEDGKRRKTSDLPNLTSNGGIDPSDMQSGRKYVVTIAGKVTEA